MAMDKYNYEVKNGVAWFTINRKTKRNAIDYDVMDGLNEAMHKARNDTMVKLLVMTGEGTEAFCSGGDLSVFHDLKTAQEAQTMLQKMADILLTLYSFPKPTIAFLNGTAVGGGAELAAACDIRIAFDDIKLGFIQGRLGITTGWGGAAFLYQRLSSASALEMLLTAEKVPVEKAQALGFVQYVIERENPDSFTNQLNRYLTLSPEVLSAYKLDYLQGIDLNGLKKQVYQEVNRCSVLWESDEHHNAVEAFRLKK